MTRVPSPPAGLTSAAPFPPDCDALYRCVAPLGQGGFGAVYRAEHRQLGRPAAVKLLLHDVLEDPEQVRRFTEEGRITAAIHHPGVVRVLDAGAEYGIPWIAYELVSGQSLRERLDAGPLDMGFAADAAAQVCDALAAAHAAGVVHRDIKPDNVLVGPSGRCTVMDFGIASWARRNGVKTATGVILGTPAYLSPEQILGNPAGPASDLYAVGVLLYELLTGAPPYGIEPPLLVLERHLKSEVPRPSKRRPEIPAALDAAVGCAMAKEPAARPASAQAMSADLLAAIAPRDPRPHPRPPAPPLRTRTPARGTPSRTLDTHRPHLPYVPYVPHFLHRPPSAP